MKESIESICKKILTYGKYRDYRIIKTTDIIEIKLSPIDNKEEEVNYIIENIKSAKLDLKITLEKYLSL